MGEIQDIVYLLHEGAQSSNAYSFQKPMYTDLKEVLELLCIELEDLTHMSVEYFRTLESGVVEEFVCVGVQDGRKTLLFRTWPVFYSHRKRVEYAIYVNDESIRQAVPKYLQLFAITNHARLLSKG